jgi:S1-C subfamily serine protease
MRLLLVEVDPMVGGAVHKGLRDEGHGVDRVREAGLQPGDGIVKFDGHEIERSSELSPLVAQVAPGTKVPAEVWRDSSPVSSSSQ